jgi:hypothetical protein
MSFRRIVVVAAALALLPLSASFARGAGGVTWGQQYFDSQLASNDLQATMNGVFGYSTSRGGQRIGGFAMAVHGPFVDGGFVGAIAGQEMRTGIFSAGMNLWTGFGGLSASPVTLAGGSFALFGELDLELGFGFIPGVQLTGYAGMQAMMGIPAGRPSFEDVMYTPVFGLRIAWGSF